MHWILIPSLFGIKFYGKKMRILTKFLLRILDQVSFIRCISNDFSFKLLYVAWPEPQRKHRGAAYEGLPPTTKLIMLTNNVNI